jgi:hypothetical protein
LFRHSLATLAYRTLRTVQNAPAGFATFDAGHGNRAPVQLLAHLSDLCEWSATLVEGAPRWNPAEPLEWEDEKMRFFRTLTALDKAVEQHQPGLDVLLPLMQGPLSDAFTHTGQLAQLRRLTGSPMRSEVYLKADIAIGRTTHLQPSPRVPFKTGA